MIVINKLHTYYNILLIKFCLDFSCAVLEMVCNPLYNPQPSQRGHITLLPLLHITMKSMLLKEMKYKKTF